MVEDYRLTYPAEVEMMVADAATWAEELQANTVDTFNTAVVMPLAPTTTSQVVSAMAQQGYHDIRCAHCRDAPGGTNADTWQQYADGLRDEGLFKSLGRSAQRLWAYIIGVRNPGGSKTPTIG